jgi:pimeloyl-ACP methyl ester carboxylesterase
MSEPTRPIRQPTIDVDGSLVAHTVSTPKSFKIRAQVTVGSRKVIPVILVPGIMGSNLRVRSDVTLPDGTGVAPGEAAWRPPNGSYDGWKEARKWAKREPSQRQRILDPALLEVDDNGELDYPTSLLSPAVMKERGWGEVHAGSYAELLVELQRYLDQTFSINGRGEPEIRDYWQKVMEADTTRWGVRTIDRITRQELEKYAAYQYPVYAVGYNWLQSCAISSERLSKRIDEIKRFWTSRKHECEKVILITHSMGGLVARACAKSRGKGLDDPADIGGIIHGVMPALGAPVAYRRLACGTEGGKFTGGFLENVRAGAFAEIAGETPEQTTPVMAASAGVLELLPNQLYPGPWLRVSAVNTVNKEEKYTDLLSLPQGNPYDLYRDMQSWFRMVNPALADPAHRYAKYPNGAADAIKLAIDAAEELHTRVLGAAVATADEPNPSKPYYHPNSYAFYGSDEERRSFGVIHWVARVQPGQSGVLTPGNVRKAKFISQSTDGVREVEVEGRHRLFFRTWMQDAPGDDTVPRQSGSGPAPHVRQIFATHGYGHQDGFQQSDVLLLTRHLIVKIVQGFK